MNFFIEIFLRRREMLENWRIWAEKIAEVVKKLIPDAEIYVVGSVVRGDYVASSDVDIIIVSNSILDSIRVRSRIKALIEEKLGLPYYHPFEIHLLKPGEAQQYFRRAGKYALRIK